MASAAALSVHEIMRLHVSFNLRGKNLISIREVTKKKNGYFTVRLTAGLTVAFVRILGLKTH